MWVTNLESSSEAPEGPIASWLLVDAYRSLQVSQVEGCAS